MASVKVHPDRIHEFKDAKRFYSGSASITTKKMRSGSRSTRWIRGSNRSPQRKPSTSRSAGAGSTRCARASTKELPAALHAARQEEHLEPDQRRQRRPADRGRPHDRARARAGRGGQVRRPLGRAYHSGKEMKLPGDLQAAIDAEPKARRMLEKLSEQNRFALAFRIHNMKTEAGRRKKIASFVEMLKRGETIYPQRQKS